MEAMRDSFIELMYAKECLSNYKELSLSDMFFEETDEIKDTNKNNDNLLHKATTAVSSAIKKLIDMLKTCIDKIKEFISTRFMTKEQRMQYKAIKKSVMSNPSLANKAIDMVTLAPYTKAYDDGLNELNRLEKSGNITEDAATAVVNTVSDKVNNIKNNVKSTAVGAATRMTLKSAIQVAEKDILVAQDLNKVLNSEIISLEDLVGENDANRYKEQASKTTKKAIFHRFKSGLLRKKQETVLDCLKMQTRSILGNFTELNKTDEEREYINRHGKVKKKVVSADSLLNGVSKYSNQINEIGGGGNVADTIASGLIRHSSDRKSAARKYKRNRFTSNVKYKIKGK